MTEEMNAARAEAITGARNWAAVRSRYPERVDAMASGLVCGDALADAVIEEMFGGAGPGWREVIALLDAPERPADLPPALRAFLDSVETPPAWFDPSMARAGAEAWWRFGSLQSGTLYQSLIYGYQARGFIRPLVQTGRLTEGTWDRVQATARWVTLATAPDLMRPGAAGWTETVRIRLVHAMVRHHLRGSGDWDDAQWGVPINQTYMQFTVAAGFLVLPLQVAKDLGIRYSSADLEAITHLWRWIGWVMGVEQHRLPADFDDARQIHDIAKAFRMHPEEESRVLVRALLNDGYRTDLGLPGPLNDAVHMLSRPFMRALFQAISMRWVDDDDVATAMGLRGAPLLHHVVDLARPVIRSRELARSVGLLGPERIVAQRELRLVTNRLGINLADTGVIGRRYRGADKGHLDTVA